MLRVVRLAPRPNKAHILSKEHRETMTRFAMTLYAWAVAMTAGVVLAACTTDGVRIGNVYHVTPYSKNLVQYTAAPGEIAVDIHGDAFIDQVPEDAEEIARRLRLPAWIPPARFTTRPSDLARGQQRIVLAFNAAARGPIGYGLCRDPGSAEYAVPRRPHPIGGGILFGRSAVGQRGRRNRAGVGSRRPAPHRPDDTVDGQSAAPSGSLPAEPGMFGRVVLSTRDK